jgi:hypothetical protein
MPDWLDNFKIQLLAEELFQKNNHNQRCYKNIKYTKNSRVHQKTVWLFACFQLHPEVNSTAERTKGGRISHKVGGQE